MPENFDDPQKISLEELGTILQNGKYSDPHIKQYFQAGCSYVNVKSQKEMADQANHTANYAKRQAKAAESTAKSTKRSVKIMMLSVIVLMLSSIASLVIQFLDYSK